MLQVTPRMQTLTLKLINGAAISWIFSVWNPSAINENFLSPLGLYLVSEAQCTVSNILVSPFDFAYGPDRPDLVPGAGPGNDRQCRSQALPPIFISPRHFLSLLY